MAIALVALVTVMLSKVMLKMSEIDSLPILRADDFDCKVELWIRTSWHGVFMSLVLMHMASSAVSMVHPVTVMLDELSMSMPSLLGTSLSPCRVKSGPTWMLWLFMI